MKRQPTKRQEQAGPAGTPRAGWEVGPLEPSRLSRLGLRVDTPVLAKYFVNGHAHSQVIEACDSPQSLSAILLAYRASLAFKISRGDVAGSWLEVQKAYRWTNESEPSMPSLVDALELTQRPCATVGELVANIMQIESKLNAALDRLNALESGGAVTAFRARLTVFSQLDEAVLAEWKSAAIAPATAAARSTPAPTPPPREQQAASASPAPLFGDGSVRESDWQTPLDMGSAATIDPSA